MLPAARRAVTSVVVFVVPLLILAQTAPLRGANESGTPPPAASKSSTENSDTALALVPLPRQAPEVPWPGNDWPQGPLPNGIARDRLDRSLAVVDARDARLGETRAVVIIQRGRLVLERYMAGFGPDTPLVSWSMAKSVTQTLLDIAVRRKLVAIDKPISSPHWPARDTQAAIT